MTDASLFYRWMIYPESLCFTGYINTFSEIITEVQLNDIAMFCANIFACKQLNKSNASRTCPLLSIATLISSWWTFFENH